MVYFYWMVATLAMIAGMTYLGVTGHWFLALIMASLLTVSGLTCVTARNIESKIKHCPKCGYDLSNKEWVDKE